MLTAVKMTIAVPPPTTNDATLNSHDVYTLHCRSLAVLIRKAADA